ncbi:MAG: Gfo/Idh/MocA family oxidoreductase [Nitrospiraceae bacterium]|nr:Gfo/Idh/MocA family oxidoreductase [Nitrospiraceae bacterium]
MPLRIGVIGVGYLGRHHARIYSELEGVELTAVADADPVQGAEIAGRYGCRFFMRYADLFPLCDAVSIVTPTTTHHEVAMECLAAGKDILLEKPITESIDEADALIGEAERRSRILQVGHLERYNPGILAATGMITQPRFVESERISPFLGRGIDVDVTLDLMIHDIDIVLSIVQAKPVDIRAIGERVLTDKVDVAKAWLEFENGCKALITASRLSPEKQRRLRVFQRDSLVSVDYQSHEVRRYYKNGSDIACETLNPEDKEPLKEELKDFIRCVETRSRPRVSGLEARDALRVALRINEMVDAR